MESWKPKSGYEASDEALLESEDSMVNLWTNLATTIYILHRVSWRSLSSQLPRDIAKQNRKIIFKLDKHSKHPKSY